jgi:hypothetical protein
VAIYNPHPPLMREEFLNFVNEKGNFSLNFFATFAPVAPASINRASARIESAFRLSVPMRK